MNDFSALLERPAHPAMEPQDYGKLAYQSEFGPEHLVTEEQAALDYILAERDAIPPGEPPCPEEDLGGGLCRCPIRRDMTPGECAALARLFVLTAGEIHGTVGGLEAKLAAVDALSLPGWADWRRQWAQAGYPAVHHSAGYRAACHPHYRVVRREYARFLPALGRVLDLLAEKERAVIAIDGRCGSGKSGLAALMARLIPCTVIHTDDFYLPPERRPQNWEQTPCANMDLLRLGRETILPARQGKAIYYRAYSCERGEYLPGKSLPPRPLTVVDGSYSHHPELAELYDLKIFLTCPPEEQRRRLRAREGDYFPMFRRRWMPLEEGYFAQYEIPAAGDLTIDTAGLFEP